MRAAARGFLTVQDLADHIGCARESIYFAVERPSRYPHVHKKLTEALA